MDPLSPGIRCGTGRDVSLSRLAIPRRRSARTPDRCDLARVGRRLASSLYPTRFGYGSRDLSDSHARCARSEKHFCDGTRAPRAQRRWSRFEKHRFLGFGFWMVHRRSEKTFPEEWSRTLRDRVKPAGEPGSRPWVDGFDAFHSPRLSPADGLDSAASLFTASPIESLELLKELGDIAAASIFATEIFLGNTEPVPVAEAAAAPSPSVPAPIAAAAPSAKTPTSDDRLMEALLEYHRLRGPKLGAKSSPRPSAETNFSRADSTAADSGHRFSSVEIPVIQDVVPKTSPGGIRASRPVQTILKPKPRS